MTGGSHRVTGELGMFVEDGKLEIDGTPYGIMKEGMFSGSWNLTHGTSVIYRAQKSNPFTRTFEIDGEAAYTLAAESPLMRAMRLSGPGHRLVLAPVHPFTRRATVVGSWSDLRLVAFAFWLTTLMWRRARKSAS